MEQIIRLDKPTQELRRNLKHVAFNLEQACIDQHRLVQRIDYSDVLELIPWVSNANKQMTCSKDIKGNRISTTNLGT